MGSIYEFTAETIDGAPAPLADPLGVCLTQQTPTVTPKARERAIEALL